MAEEYLATHKLSESRVKHFNVLVRTLKRYELYRKLSNKRFVLDVHTMTPVTLDDIGTFMMSEPQIFDEHPELYDEVPYARSKVRKNLPVKRGPYTNEAGETVIPGRPRERGMNYVSDMLIRLRSFYVWLTNNGHTTNDPFRQYKIGEIVYGTPIYITTEERKQLAAADMGDDKQLETQRDIFVFQCMIGCRVSDLYKMTYSNIINGTIEYVPRKTRDDRPAHAAEYSGADLRPGLVAHGAADVYRQCLQKRQRPRDCRCDVRTQGRAALLPAIGISIWILNGMR